MNSDEIKQRRRAYYLKNKDIIKEKTKQYYLKHKDQCQEYHKKYKKEYYLENKDILYEKNKQYRLKNKDKIKERNEERIKTYNTQYYKDNKESIKQRTRDYRKNNPEKCNTFKAQKRAKKFLATPENANQNIIRTFYEMSNRLTKCLGIQFHVDHLIPLNKGGLHYEDNLLPVPAFVNMSKHDRIDFSHPFYSHLGLNILAK